MNDAFPTSKKDVPHHEPSSVVSSMSSSSISSISFSSSSVVRSCAFWVLASVDCLTSVTGNPNMNVINDRSSTVSSLIWSNPASHSTVSLCCGLATVCATCEKQIAPTKRARRPRSLVQEHLRSHCLRFVLPMIMMGEWLLPGRNCSFELRDEDCCVGSP